MAYLIRLTTAGPCLLALTLVACPTGQPEGNHSLSPSPPTSATPRARPAPRARSAARRTPPVTRSAPARARVPARAVPATPRPRVDPTNRVAPVAQAPQLARQGATLFRAVAAGDASLARDAFFPRKPFTPLKRAGNPDAYWQHLWRLFQRDVRRLRRRHRDWSGASFDALTLAARPRWIAPGGQANHIGYYNARYARLTYRLAGRRYTIFVHTMITWQGRFYVTHLSAPPRRKK